MSFNEEISGIEYVVFKLNTFQFNAGILGFIRLLEYLDADKGKGCDYFYDKDYLYVSKEYILKNNLTDAYIRAHIKRYEKETAYNDIINAYEAIKNLTEKYEKSGDRSDKKNLDNKYKLVIDKLSRKSYKEGYIILQNNCIDCKIEELILAIKETKSYTEKLDKLNVILSEFTKKEYKETLCFKDIMYNRVNMLWTNKAFLNNNFLKHDIKELYRRDFEIPFKEMLNTKNSKKKKVCIECSAIVYKLFDISFLVDTVEDMARKKSVFWNCIPDTGVCAACAFIYSLTPLGFFSVGRNLMFINVNYSVKALEDLNSTAGFAYDGNVEDNKKISQIYNSMINSESVYNLKKLSNIQVITRKKYDKGNKYQFNIIGRDLLEVIKKSQKELEYLTKIFVKDEDEFINVYSEVITNIFNYRRQYSLMNRLLILSLREEKAGSTKYIYNILKIQIFQRGEDKMGKAYKTAMAASFCGRDMRKTLTSEVLAEKDVDNKLRGFVYQLLNALQSGNRESFLNLIIRMYSSIGKPVPGVFLSSFESEENFKDIGYAYVLGLKNEEYEKEGEDKRNE
jgi:CRISPR-associated protein Cst1